MSQYDVIIIGGGASGLMCAGLAAQSGMGVLLLEHNSKWGRKILASGGGNCNFTNLEVGPGDYQSQNPHFCKSALTRYPAQSFIDLVESHRVEYYEKKLGQLFAGDGAQKILDLLLAEAQAGGVQMVTGCEANKVSRTEDGFVVQAGPQSFEAKNLVLATGGLSYKGLGASDFGFRVAQQFGLKRVATAPALVPFLYGGYQKLAGLALPVEITAGNHSFADDFLFTHLGFSGPAVLKASLYWEPGQSVQIDFLPGAEISELIAQAKRKGGVKSLGKLLAPLLPAKFIEHWLEKEVVLPPKDLQNLTQAEIKRLTQAFHAWRFVPQGTEGYKKAEVTKGGIDTGDISSKSMEAKSVKGLYLIGELLDVTGLLGGYNFHWAWASAHAAAQALLASSDGEAPG